MKRYGNLYPAIIDFENLLASAYRARRGKRYRPDVAAFHFQLEEGLLTLRQELEARTYQPGPPLLLPKCPLPRVWPFSLNRPRQP